ncbi:MAG: hypothetical protein AAGG69_04595 [Pseudomonadota bacterium]
MKLLIANERIAKLTGTEVVARDFARGFRKRGVDVSILTKQAGQLAGQLRSEGFDVVDQIEQLRMPPDIVHMNDLAPVDVLAQRLPSVPTLLHWHKFVPEDIAWPAGSVTTACGVSPRICEKIEKYTGLKKVRLLGNYVDLDTLVPRVEPLPNKPNRWLFVAQQKRSRLLALKLSLIAIKHGARLHLVGPQVFKRVENLGSLTSQFDLVFASGRCALEAACTGVAVVPCDPNGVAACMTTENMARYRQGNFTYAQFDAGPELNAIGKAISAYNASEAEEAAKWVRQDADLTRGLDQLLAIYSEILR